MSRLSTFAVVGLGFMCAACGGDDPPAPAPVIPPAPTPACELQSPSENEFLGASYFFALAPVPESPTDPFLFLATFNVQADGIQVTTTPLDRNDRATTTSDTQIFGPFPNPDDGTFEATLDDVVIPPRTNPLGDQQVVGTFTLTGGFCESPRSLFCGTFTGELTVPDSVPLAGTWAADEIETASTDFVVDCDGTEGTSP